MMKKSLLVFAISLAMSSVVMAAPITNLQDGQSAIGVNYWNPVISVNNSHPYQFSEVYAETALSESIIVGIDYATANLSNTSIDYGYYNASNDLDVLDINLKYKVNKNIQLIAGNRNSSDSVTVSDNWGNSVSEDNASTNQFFYGAGATVDIGTGRNPSNIYASVLKSDIFTDKQVGINLNLTRKTDLNINYRQYNQDNYTLKGVGVGINYKF